MESPQPPPSVRTTMAFLWNVVAGILLTDFIKESYRVIDTKPSPANVLFISACTIYLVKTLFEYHPYFQNKTYYDVAPSNDTRQYIQILAENLLELLVLFFVYGTIHYVNLGLDPRLSSFPSLAGSALLRNAMFVELAWFTWGAINLVKWQHSLKDIALIWRPLFILASRNSRDHVFKLWLVTNLGWTGIFFWTWRWFPASTDPIRIHEVIVLVAEMTVFSVWSFTVFRDYYMGNLEDVAQTLPKDRERFEIWQTTLVRQITSAKGLLAAAAMASLSKTQSRVLRSAKVLLRLFRSTTKAFTRLAGRLVHFVRTIPMRLHRRISSGR
jgi:multisubunit Na+/H+ antiporter MnhF subunit